MLDKKDFGKIREELETYELRREGLIRQSRDMVKLSKLAIYSLHRRDMNSAEKSVADMESRKKSLDLIARKNRRLQHMESYTTAVQEYVEAKTYLEFVKKKRIPSRRELNVDLEPYLGGLCDLSGELVRKALNDMINHDFKEPLETKKLLEELYGEFLKFNLGGGELRKKSDSLRWNLNKLEDLIFEAKMKGKI